MPFPSPGDLPDPGIKPTSPALAGGFFTTSVTWEAPFTENVSEKLLVKLLLFNQLNIYLLGYVTGLL